jgi:hypothetical protein
MTDNSPRPHHLNLAVGGDVARTAEGRVFRIRTKRNLRMVGGSSVARRRPVRW